MHYRLPAVTAMYQSMSVLVCDACDSQVELGVHDGVDGLILSL